MRETLSGTVVVVEGDDGDEAEVNMDDLLGNFDEELSQCLLIGRAVRDALMREENDGATAIVRCYAQ